MYELNRSCIFTERLMILLLMICVSFAANKTDFIIGCENTESDCYQLIPPCTDNEKVRCLKTCGTCSETESVFSYENNACFDHPSCLVYSFPNDCSSSILTWPREHCLLSCNLCPSYQKATAAVNISASKPNATMETITVNPNNGGDRCMDRWPYCHSIPHNCTKLSVEQSTIEKWCSKTCGICKGMETRKKSMDVTCEDDVDCSPYNLNRDCLSNNTWFQDHCAKSCNKCLYVTTLHVNTNINEAMDLSRVTYDVTTIVVAGITAITVIIVCLLFLHKNKAKGQLFV